MIRCLGAAVYIALVNTAGASSAASFSYAGLVTNFASRPRGCELFSVLAF